ncbi:hypothetical protein BTH160X_270104 [Brochothrix thermosphacta]|nr:hypothetical protein BTH160X_270104 [Brochothrix thermosphacta]
MRSNPENVVAMIIVSLYLSLALSEDIKKETATALSIKLNLCSLSESPTNLLT